MTDTSSTNQADEQMAERLQKYLHALPEIYKGFREDISALIATVKALRAENGRLIKERDRAREDVRILTKGRFIQS